MNKWELIERIKCLKNIFGNKTKYVEKDMVIKLISELDEPQKVVVPQFVADWIEECEEKEKTLLNSLLYTPEGVNSWVGNSDNQELFARAWIEGYEVEKEKRYLVRVKGIDGYGRYLNKASSSKTYCFASEIEKYGYKTKHTRKELEEANFGWVFDCEGIEIEEVE
jgi:phage protein|nr:MAG TPA: Protein of unknown function (DUF1642) [Caudoviricetes sp.]